MSTSFIRTISHTAGLALVVLLACGKRDSFDDHAYRIPSPGQPPRFDEPVAKGGGPLSIDAAIDRIAKARCKRANRCQEIGVARTWSDRDACEKGMKQNITFDLLDDDCPGGIDSARLVECLRATRNEVCGSSSPETVLRQRACSTANLCRTLQ